MRIAGRVTDGEGLPLADLPLRVYDQRGFGRGEGRQRLLGEVRTGPDGGYQLDVSDKSAPQGARPNVNVFVVALDQGGRELARSDTVFGAREQTRVDLRLAADTAGIESEYERLLAAVQRLLQSTRRELTDLDESENERAISFVAAEAGFSAEAVEHLVLAHRLAQRSKLDADIFYAMLRERALLRVEDKRPLRTRLTVTVKDDPQVLLFDLALLPPETLRDAAQRASRKRIVPRSSLERLPRFLAGLEHLRGKAEEFDRTERPQRLFRLIEHALAQGVHERVLDILSKNYMGHLPELISALQEAAVFKEPAGAADAGVKLELAELLGPEEILIEEVREAEGLRSPQDVQRLAALSPGDWRELLGKSKALRQGKRTAPREEVVALHASRIARTLEQRFPTVAFRAQLARDGEAPVARREQLAAFLEEHPELELGKTHVERFFKERQLGKDAGGAEIKEELKRVQRVFKLAPTYRQTAALLKANAHSAQQLAAMGQTQVVKRLTISGGLSVREAREVYARAVDVHIATAFLAAELRTAAGDARVEALSQPVAEAKMAMAAEDFPHLKSLFSMGDVCACEHCRSVHGPAAYLADALQFLKNRVVQDTTGPTPVSLKAARDVLFSRRPDLGDLDLSCENALTPLPIIDVVCELLEEVVAPDPGVAYSGTLAAGAVPTALVTALETAGQPISAGAVLYGPDLGGHYVLRGTAAVYKLSPAGSGNWTVRRLRQTHRSAAELAAAPEYVNDAAYAALRTRRIAFQLPFDLHHEEARGYFEQFGFSRDALMRSLQASAGPQEVEIAGEQLGLSDVERQLVTQADVAGQPAYWNTSAGPASAVMKTVSTLLDRTGLEYAHLEELLRQSFVNPTGALFIKHLDDSCDLDQKEVQGLDDGALDRIHRFLRLRRATRWTMAELGRALQAPRLGSGTLDGPLLVRIAGFARLRERLGMPLDELTAFYGLIPRDGDGSLYARLFLSDTANGGVAPELRPEAVASNEAAAPATQRTLADVAGPLAAALGVTPSELSVFLGAFGTGAILDFANLATLFAQSRLSRKLGLDAANLLALAELTGTHVLDSPADTLAFIDQAEKVKGNGLTPVDLRFLLAHSAPNLAERMLKEAAITALLGKLQQGLQAAFLATRSAYDATLSADENGSALKDALGRLPGFDEEAVARYLRITSDLWNDTTQTPLQFIDARLTPLFDTTAIKARLAALQAASGTKEAERQALIRVTLEAIAAYLFQGRKVEVVLSTLGASFRMDEPLAAVVLQKARLKQPTSAGNRTLLEVFGDEALVDTVNTPPQPPALTPAAFPNLYRASQLLHKLLAMVAAMKLGAEEVGWELERASALGWMELDRLPYEAGQPAISFAAWERVADARALAAAYPPAQHPDDPAVAVSLWTVLERALITGATAQDVLRLFAAWTGLDRNVLSALDTRFALSGINLNAYKLPATYVRLERAAVLLRRLGLDVAGGVAVAQPQLSSAQVAALRTQLRARYEERDWLGVLGRLQDVLRARKRDALVAYLVATDARFSSATDLYDHFLIDVQMSACQPTSRIVQAHAAVQLFVQRCLMGLEPQAVADVREDRGWEQWKWMKAYRVWEANRKVFLYPENWTEPELRDDKSPFFRELETDLQQSDVTERAVEDCTHGYLEKLDEVAFLEVMAVHYETELYTMHVFARTKGGDPAIYYYRRFEKERAWTPWEKVELDITGDHLLAFVRNRRLHLVWPLFSEEADEGAQLSIPDPDALPQTAERAKKRWKIQLAVSEHNGRKWLPKRLSREALTTWQSFEQLPAKEDFRFSLFDFSPANASIVVSYVDNGRTSWNDTPSGNTRYLGSFALTGCKGYPEPIQGSARGMSFQFLPVFKDTALKDHRYRELGQDATNDLAMMGPLTQGTFATLLENTPETAPGIAPLFKLTYPHQMSDIDRLLLPLQLFVLSHAGYNNDRYSRLMVPLGTLMPFFFGDAGRAFVLIPGYYGERREGDATPQVSKTFSDIQRLIDDIKALGLKYLKKFAEDPAHDAARLWAELAVDPEFVRLQAELAVYRTLQQGTRFEPFYHPLACFLRATLYREGIPGLMRRETQRHDTGFDFAAASAYKPTAQVVRAYPREDLDFRRQGAYAGYNWELFFHLPFLVAVRLSQNQRFEEAMAWFHYIFNPVGAQEGPSPNKYWVTRPFYEHGAGDYLAQRIDTLLYQLAGDPSGASLTELKFAVEEWRDKPFRPFVVARSRPVAFQKAVLMKYLDNLIAWGDSLFRGNTLESINEATQLYVLAEKLLGPRPRVVPPAVHVPPQTYNQLEEKLDLFGNALLELENLVPDLGLLPHGGAELPSPPTTLASLYFCIPQNEKLLEYWDRVADRLFKIRHCQDIDGNERVLALFAPPIDPGALVRAAAAGVGVGELLAGFNAPLPHYRFQVSAQKATELVQELRVLGGALLQALEKRDAEQLILLRSELELKVLNAVKAVREQQALEAEVQISALDASMDLAVEKQRYYSTRQKVSPWEAVALLLSGLSLIPQGAALALNVAAGVVHLIPNFNIGISGFGGSPQVTATWGSTNITGALGAFAGAASGASGVLQTSASLASTLAGYERRKEEWDFQAGLAGLETVQLKRQKAAAVIRKDIAVREVTNQQLQIDNALTTDTFYREKFTRRELYDWMVGQVSAIYFRAYQLAFDMAKKAERCFRHELGSDATFIQFSSWDSLRKGLAAADHLLHDLKRMEATYLDLNAREYELTKHVSLASLDPLALVQLKTTGKCTVQLPEALFDLDNPGHYMRRLKAVSVTVPCVTGPYTPVSCKLTLVSSRYRRNTAQVPGGATARDKYAEAAGNDSRFAYNVGTAQSIVTSQAQNDSGMFELNFRDDRYLPFEGQGAVGTWQVELSANFPQFDHRTITDLVLHLRYTARDGGRSFKTLVESALAELLDAAVLDSGRTGLYRAFHLRHEFPNEWARLKQDGSVSLRLDQEHLPFFTQGHSPTVTDVTWVARVQGSPTTFALQVDGAAVNLNQDSALGNLNKGSSGALALGTPVALGAASTAPLEELIVVVHYTVT